MTTYYCNKTYYTTFRFTPSTNLDREGGESCEFENLIQYTIEGTTLYKGTDCLCFVGDDVETYYNMLTAQQKEGLEKIIITGGKTLSVWEKDAIFVEKVSSIFCKFNGWIEGARTLTEMNCVLWNIVDRTEKAYKNQCASVDRINKSHTYQ